MVSRTTLVQRSLRPTKKPTRDLARSKQTKNAFQRAKEEKDRKEREAQAEKHRKQAENRRQRKEADKNVKMQEEKSGRPRGGPHIENIRFWDLPDSRLRFISKDAHKAMKANPTAKKATGKWADELNDAQTVLGWRKRKGISMKEAKQPTPNPKAVAAAKFGGRRKVGQISKSDLEWFKARSKAIRLLHGVKEGFPKEKEDDDDTKGSGAFMVQLRKVVSLRGIKPVTFEDGDKAKIGMGTARAILAKHAKMRPAEKEKFQRNLSKSKKDFDSASKGLL
tara:strand:+ start:1320 stop:2156 length:837 start_codon:yes stop_codon:yes gene_type:complete